jgi:hypothetical protein
MNINDQRKNVRGKAINEMDAGMVFIDDDDEVMMVIRAWTSGELGVVSLENGKWYDVDRFHNRYEVLNATVVIE